ncbi:MAG TPA: PAN domain-containing protein [Xanthobacteraceae bacterium]|nr:PAN domain-containing protein [Xanthobacteraceae bacterium]
MIRAFIALTLTIAAVLCLPPESCAQVGFDRRGGDYANFTVRSGDPGACAARCDREPRCRAWSFNYPTADRAGVCWLKSQVPPRVEDGASASGVRGAGVIEPRHGMREFSIDRTGGDYRNLDVAPDPIGETCKMACDAEPQCRAWTYVRPGYLGPEARCFLKDHVRAPHHKPCCISGVVR